MLYLMAIILLSGTINIHLSGHFRLRSVPYTAIRISGPLWRDDGTGSLIGELNRFLLENPPEDNEHGWLH
jgi:hypothetical protein